MKNKQNSYLGKIVILNIMVSKFSDIAVKKREEDKLGFNDYAMGIIATIESVPEDDTPFTIAIFGPWVLERPV